MKKKRLFLRGPQTDDQWWYCGGPDKEDARNGVGHLLATYLDGLLDGNEAGYDHGVPIEIAVRELTDEEVAELPEQ